MLSFAKGIFLLWILSFYKDSRLECKTFTLEKILAKPLNLSDKYTQHIFVEVVMHESMHYIAKEIWETC